MVLEWLNSKLIPKISENHESSWKIMKSAILESRFQIALGSCGNTVSFQSATKRWLIRLRSSILTLALTVTIRDYYTLYHTTWSEQYLGWVQPLGPLDSNGEAVNLTNLPECKKCVIPWISRLESRCLTFLTKIGQIDKWVSTLTSK